MANSSNNPIPHLSTDWEFDPLSGKKFSGASVQAFIKSYLGAISKAAYFDPNTYTLYWFATDEDKAEYIADTSKTYLVLYSTQLSFSSELYRVALMNNNNATQLNVATNENIVELSVDFDVQTKAMTESTWRSTGKGAFVTAYIDINATGSYEQLTTRRFISAEETFTLDVRNALEVGVNRIRLVFESEDDASVTSSITYTINLTEMFIEPLNNEWYKPIVEGGDSAYYKLGGFRIVGAVDKTLHMDIYSGNQKVLEFERWIGPDIYDRTAYNFIAAHGFNMSSLSTGVYVVSAYLTSGDLISRPINYNIMYIRAEDRNTARLLCINNVEDVAYNYTTSKLFEYCIYNQGSVYGSLDATVRLLNGTTTATTSIVALENVATAEVHSFNFALEWLTQETLDLHIQVTMEYGNEQIATIRLDNSSTFPPAYGYDFYLNAASRSNTDTNKEKIINFVTSEELTPTWTNMTWMNKIDGWTKDEDGRACLLIPAGAKMVLPYTEHQLIDDENITLEMCYRVSNVADYDENVITICDDPTIDGFRGIRIKPTNITVHSSADSSSINDVLRGTKLMDERIVHFVLTIFRNYNGHTDRNLVTGYINGCKNFQFEYSTGTIWATNGDLVIGAERSDISLYFIRAYHSVLGDPAVQQNYINSLPTISERENLNKVLKSIMDANASVIDFKSVKDNDMNYFVVEMLNGASVPSRANGWTRDDDLAARSNLEMHYGKHPDWDWRIENVETAGQGTTSMGYYRWNLRWRIDKSTNKKANVSYVSSRRQRAGSYIYDWTDPTLSGSVNFDGAGNHPGVKRITAKINFASSMQSHKIGATRAYSELYTSNTVDLHNEAQRYASIHNMPEPCVSVYQYPVYGFEKRGDAYTFIGLFTIGPDKGDKPTFGFNIDSSISSELISMEGSDHDRVVVMFNHPWNQNMEYRSADEFLNVTAYSGSKRGGWEVGECFGYDSKESNDQANIQAVLEQEFKPAYDLVFNNSTLIFGIEKGEYDSTAEGTLAYINNHITEFGGVIRQGNRLSNSNYQFWIEDEYILYYLDARTNRYVAGINLITEHGQPSGSTVAEKNEWFKAQRRDRFMSLAENYWDIQDALYHYAFIITIGAIDNFGKNTYPYKMKSLANGGRWRWRQDDLDSILGVNNSGFDTIPITAEYNDVSSPGAAIFGGSPSVFWTLINECYMDDYISTDSQSPQRGIRSMGKSILTAMSSMAGGANVLAGVMLYFKDTFWDNAQNYFPQSAYNADAFYKYESAWIARDNQQADPLGQSLGNHYEAEYYWVYNRAIYLLSLFRVGPFGVYNDDNFGQIAFRPVNLPSLTITPFSMMYPGLGDGTTMRNGTRTDPALGETYTFNGPFSQQGQTTLYINAADNIAYLGDWKDVQANLDLTPTVTIVGKKLLRFKIGDENPLIVIAPEEYYTQQEANEYNAELEGAILSGTELTAEQVALVNAALETSYETGDTISQNDANSYNATLDGSVSIEDIKTPAVTTPNVTTNITGLSFGNEKSLPKCLEVIDARNAQSISGDVDLSNCTRLKEAYFEGTSLSQVKLANGHRIIVLHLPQTTTAISLKNLKLLQDIILPENSGRISLLNIENCDVDAFSLLDKAYRADGSQLRYVRLIFDDIQQITRDELLTICGVGSNKDKDGNTKTFNGVTESGAPSNTSDPLVEGVFTMRNGVYADDLEALDIQSEEDYGDGLKKALTGYFGSRLFIIYNPNQLGIRFADPAVEAVCLDHWDTNEDEVLSTVEAEAVTGLSTYFRENTEITEFDELKYFKGLTTIYGNSESPYGAFAGCTALKSVTIPSTVTSIGNSAFRGSGIESLDIPSTVTSVGSSAFSGCTRLSNLTIPSSVESINITAIANGTGQNGVVIVNGNLTGAGVAGSGNAYRGTGLVVKGNVSATSGIYAIVSGPYVKYLRVGGNLTRNSNSMAIINAGSGNTSKFEFFELMGTYSGGGILTNTAQYIVNGFVYHLGYNGIACTPTQAGASFSRVSKIYVGPGESQAGDQAILDQYLANSAWSAYASKLDLWWNYDGPYKETE